MDHQEARAYFNYLITLNIRGEEAFGPLALEFIKEQDLEQVGLLPEEQFNLIMATAQGLAVEPKRYNLKAELLQKAKQLLPKTSYAHPSLAQQLEHDIKKTKAELSIYNEAMRPARLPALDKQRIYVQTDIPEYFLDIAQKRASAYYNEKFGLTQKAKTAQHFSGKPRKFQPDNPDVQKEFSGACAPFMNARTNAFHMMLPFDLKISRKPDDPLDAGMRIYYAKMGYSFPLVYERDKLCNYHDGEVLDIEMDDPHLLFISVSPVKEPEFRFQASGRFQDAPPNLAYPMTVLERMGTLGPYVQVVCNFKVWFDAAVLSILVQG
ncbi:MAG: hypothetical protein VYC17_03280, partial [Nitrospinota bacterium]|nr:hypothetical protein [Nitrospinota bacterium]